MFFTQDASPLFFPLNAVLLPTFAKSRNRDFALLNTSQVAPPTVGRYQACLRSAMRDTERTVRDGKLFPARRRPRQVPLPLPAIEELVQPRCRLAVLPIARIVQEVARDRRCLRRGHRAFEALEVLDQVALHRIVRLLEHDPNV